MPRPVPLATAVLAFALATGACTDRAHPPAAPAAPAAQLGAGDSERAERARLEALARHVARALADPTLRREVFAAFTASPVPEGKVHFQDWLRAGQGRALAALARAAGLTEAALATLALEGLPLELYLPVPEHRQAWNGSDDYLVATSLRDHERPVAFDPRGRRLMLDADTPPPTPVVALVPLETNFAPRPSLAECQTEECHGGGSGGSAGGGGGTSLSLANQHLLLKYATFRDDFEGWLRGNPEYELHVLGPATGGGDSDYVSYQCIGEHAPSGYRWDMNSGTWTGSQLLFTGSQMDNLETAHPGQSFALLALEDDDTACEIRMDRDIVQDFFRQLSAIYGELRGAKDIKVLTPDGVVRIVKAGRTIRDLIAALANLLKTNDDLIGAAIADTVAGRAHPTGNWVVLRDDTVNGWLKLDVAR